MERAVMISIQPQHAINIVKRFKTLELRKSIPKDFVGWVYVYVTKGKPYLQAFDDEIIKEFPKTPKYIIDNDWHGSTDILNGKVIARFWFDEYDKYVDVSNCGMTSCGVECENDFTYRLYYLDNELGKLCLTYNEVNDYGKGKSLYAWHIKKLEVFDTPMQLSEFEVWYGGEESFYPLKRAPQSFQTVYVKGE